MTACPASTAAPASGANGNGSAPGNPRPLIYPVGAAEQIVARLSWLDAPTRALLVKDARMFWRDTTQWGQSLVLVGLLAVYVINLRHFSQESTNPFWLHLVSYLNLGACALNLATLTTRFVFPQFSLEGKRLWIVGMAPMGLLAVLKTKFWLASRAALPLAVGLIFLSCNMLQMPWNRTLYFAIIIATMTWTLGALAMGLGVLYSPISARTTRRKLSAALAGHCALF